MKETNEIVNEMLEKLKSLPDGTEICTRELAYEVYGEDSYDLEVGDIHDPLMRAARKSGLYLDFSKTEGLILGLPFNIDFVVYHKRPKFVGTLEKIVLISNSLTMLPPKDGEIVEQKLTINRNGKISISSYIWPEYKLKRPKRKEVIINEKSAAKILDSIEKNTKRFGWLQFDRFPVWEDVGSWDLKMKGSKEFYPNIECNYCNRSKRFINISNKIRELVGDNTLLCFDGNMPYED